MDNIVENHGYSTVPKLELNKLPNYNEEQDGNKESTHRRDMSIKNRRSKGLNEDKVYYSRHMSERRFGTLRRLASPALSY